jgi:hypothetical protein
LAEPAGICLQQNAAIHLQKKACFFLQLRLKYYILTAEIKQAFIRFSFHICKAILFIKKSAHIRIPCCGACCLRMRAGTPPAFSIHAKKIIVLQERICRRYKRNMKDLTPASFWKYSARIFLPVPDFLSSSDSSYSSWHPPLK